MGYLLCVKSLSTMNIKLHNTKRIARHSLTGVLCNALAVSVRSERDDRRMLECAFFVPKIRELAW